jgi:hypothetical protein
LPSIRISGSHSSHFGSHQFVSPTIVISEGTRTERMIVASSATATARPNPNCCKASIEPVENAPKMTTMMRAAPVMMRPVLRRPTATLSALSCEMS